MRLFALILGILLPVDPAVAQDAGALALPDLTGVLGRLVAVVIVVESAMAAIFNWRVYRALLNARAWKTPVMVGVGILIVLTFDYDVFAQIMVLAGGSSATTQGAATVSVGLSALIIAGGSAGINTLLLRLGLRALPQDPVAPAPALDRTEAWVSIHISGAVPKDGVQVSLREVAMTPLYPLAGVLRPQSFGDRLAAAFATDQMRFPNYGGRKVKANTGYEIALLLPRPAPGAPEPAPVIVFRGGFAERAIIDLHATL